MVFFKPFRVVDVREVFLKISLMVFVVVFRQRNDCGTTARSPHACRRWVHFNESDEMLLDSLVHLASCLETAASPLLPPLTHFYFKGQITINPPHNRTRQRVHIRHKLLSHRPN